MDKKIVIRVAGGPDLILMGHGFLCGRIGNGVGAKLDDPEYDSFVIDWDSFEAAYLALKATREQSESDYARQLANPESMVARVANAIESLRKAERDYGEPLDAIRQALGQEGTHFLDELEEFQFGWLKTALLKCGYREDVQALRHFVFHARLNGASNTCLLCLRSCDEDDEGHLADCPYFVALERVSAPGVETLVEWADRQ